MKNLEANLSFFFLNFSCKMVQAEPKAIPVFKFVATLVILGSVKYERRASEQNKMKFSSRENSGRI